MNPRVNQLGDHSGANPLQRNLALAIMFLAATSCVSTGEINQPGATLDPSTIPETDQAGLDIVSSDLLPDLVMDYSWQVAYTSSCPWGGPGYVILQGRNVGAGDAARFHIKVWDQLQLVDGLPRGEQVEVRVKFESGPVGSIPAFIDSENQVEESDEDNNELLIVFTPPPKCTPTGG